MKKVFAVLGLALAGLTTQVSATTTGLISQEQAKQIAFTHAGVTATDVIFEDIKLEFDDGKFEYDFEFTVGATEYDYEINATTGDIIDIDYEIDNSMYRMLVNLGLYTTTPVAKPDTAVTTPVTTTPAVTTPAVTTPATTTPQTTTATTYLTKDQAKAIAFAHAGVNASNVRDLEIEFDNDDGRRIYEIEWEVGNTEYECDIDAVTGNILKFEVDRD
ncbi:MAG: hypothetical protein ATN34_02565 [Epulopiscium sp. Nele67-Bin002]|nr:MAG: hypothetical protein ATN34_02565 [Epulopiscium sp. Nele67-Bin002]